MTTYATPVLPLALTASRSTGESAARADLTATLLAAAHAEPDPVRRRQLLDEVVVVNRSVAEGVASRFRNRGAAQEDLHQVAYEGLTKAVLRFDPSLGHDLLTYAVPMIRGELQRHLRDQGWTVRPPRRIQQLQRCIIDSAEALSQRLGREPLDDELMTELGVDSGDYHEAVAAFGCKRATSLDQPVGIDGSDSLGSIVAVEDRDVAATEARLVLGPALQTLPERDR